MPMNDKDNSPEEMNDWMDYLSNLNNDNIDSEDTDGFMEEETFDTNLDDLMSMLDSSQNSDSEYEVENDKSFTTDDDMLNMFMNMGNEEEAADFDEISRMLNASDNKNNHNEDTPMDVGDVFSDALKVVSSLKDDIEEDLLNLIPDNTSMEDSIKKNKKKQKRKILKEIEEKSEFQPESKVKKGKKSLEGLKGLFAKKEKTEEIENNSSKEEGTIPSEIQLIKSVDESKKKIKKEKKKKQKAATKKAKTKSAVAEEENPKDKKKGNKAKSVKEKKQKVKVAKPLKEVIDEIEEEEGTINPVAASIVVALLGVAAIVIVVGTNLFSYSSSINKATNYFDRQKYTQAYNEVNGIDVKDEDVEIYDKIMTVMYVNKQLNSYNTYFAASDYPNALDSLLKGLKRYDKYIELATVYGIQSDLNYVRGQILAELKNEFKISEKEAVKLMKKMDHGQYASLVNDKINEVLEQ